MKLAVGVIICLFFAGCTVGDAFRTSLSSARRLVRPWSTSSSSPIIIASKSRASLMMSQEAVSAEAVASAATCSAHHTKKLVSPFAVQPAGGESQQQEEISQSSSSVVSQKKVIDSMAQNHLILSTENVEKVLDELRPTLQSDGGDVRLVSIEGSVVILELLGACDTCASSTMTLKMGIERRLKEVIPSISEVKQAKSMIVAPDVCVEEVEKVLDGVRPFLSIAGASIEVEAIDEGILQPIIRLKLIDLPVGVTSIKTEIVQRMQRHFGGAPLKVEWQ